MLLIANVNAQTVTPGGIAVIERALASEFKLDVERTKRGGHATHLARGAVHDGYDFVVALGGDGTVNEIANGLVHSDVALGVIPGGSTNVLARSLGIPDDPIEATSHLLNLRNRAPRRISLGRADGRYFLFACGVGFDGAIVRQVERRQRLKKAVGQGYYVWSGVRIALFRYSRRRPLVHVRWGPELEHRRDGLFLAIAQNMRPFTYLGRLEMHICPKADLDGGIDCFALDRFRVMFLLKQVVRTFGSHRHIRSRHALYVHDQERVEISCDEPLPMQMDGEYIGETTRALIESVPNALSILC
ncbi:MAG: diacylglycerol/lipid kinase family protein [Actinomycetota bacterium]